MPDLVQQLQSTLGPSLAIESELGGGGMSRVFVAADAALGRQVVVKILAPELGGRVNLERFRREIQISASLQHPCIVPVLTAELVDGIPYYTMPYVAGESLRARLVRGGPPRLNEGVRILRDVASALACAHAGGVVHRDLKPENVLLSSGYALVTDFGVAKAVSSSRAADDANLTALGIAVGTPAYMAPEQAVADAGVDHSADVYAFGVMAYEVLTGFHPFSTRSPQEMLAAHVLETPPPIVERRPSLPAPLASLVMRCLSKRQVDRPRAAEIVGELDAVATSAAHRTTESMPSSGTLTSFQGASARGTMPSVAVLPFRNLSRSKENEYFSDGITEELLNALARLRTVHVAARTSSFAFKGKDLDLREVGEQLGVSTILEGSVRRSGKRLRVTAQLVDARTGFQLWSDRYDREAAEVFEIEDEIAAAIVDTLKVTLLRPSTPSPAPRHTNSLEAYELYLRGRYFWNQTGVGMERALELFEQALTIDPDFAHAHAGIADVFIGAGIFEAMPPGEAFPLARAAAERARALDESLAEAHTALGAISLFHDWDLSAARESLERAIALNPSYTNAHTWLAMHHVVRGDTDGALSWARRAIQIDPLAAPALYSELFALYTGRRFEEAVECAGRVLKLNPAYAEGYRCLGSSLLLLSRSEEAVEALKQAVLMGGSYAWAVTNLAVAKATLGDEAEARRHLAELVERSRSEWISPITMAAVHVALQEVDEAFARLEQSHEGRDCWLITLRVDPAWDTIRDDPRFQSLVERVGLA